jgi:hypothetical protein
LLECITATLHDSADLVAEGFFLQTTVFGHPTLAATEIQSVTHFGIPIDYDIGIVSHGNDLPARLVDPQLAHHQFIRRLFDTIDATLTSDHEGRRWDSYRSKMNSNRQTAGY